MAKLSQAAREKIKREAEHARRSFLRSSEDRFSSLEEIYWRDPNAEKGKIAIRVCDPKQRDIVKEEGV